MNRFKWLICVSACGIAALPGLWGQQNAPSAKTPLSAPAVSQSPPGANPNGDFTRQADEVLAQMSQILDLPIKEPLKKSLRSKQEIRNYLIREEKEDKDEVQRYADEKSLEVFGLIPKDFPLDSFMLDVLTDQIAGLYDPKSKEFYIADWIPAEEQRSVMSHELTHALEDQSFQIDPWIKAARPNDDAELARESVSEGSAMAAMLDYSLRDNHASIRDLPDVTAAMRAGALQEMDTDQNLVKAPIVIRDGLLFPYLAGIRFSQEFLKAHSGWADLKILFENPPVSSQQILHPDLYLHGVKPEKVALPDWKNIVPADWRLLEENVMGEFGVEEVLKQFVGQERADLMSPKWAGDRYAIFEDSKTKENPLVFYLVLDDAEDAARFLGQYSEVLELKYKVRTELYRRPNFFQFQTPDGGVFLRCVDTRCLTVESATRDTFDKIDAGIGWAAAPSPASPSPTPSTTALDGPEKSVAQRAGN